MDLLSIIGLIGVVVGGVGLMLAIKGWRGRRVDDHPLCRRCRFDLFGLPADRTRCPECGGPTASPRVGNRERRPMHLGIGVVLLAAVVVPTLVQTTFWASGKGYQAHPVFLLRYEAEQRDDRARERAVLELTRRLNAGELSQPQIDAIADRFIAIHANEVPDFSRRMWDVFGPLDQSMLAWIDACQAAGKLTPERWDKHLRSSAHALVEVRPRVRQGDPLPALIRTYIRVPGGYTNSYTVNAFIDGQPVSLDLPPSSTPGRPHYGGDLRANVSERDRLLAGLALGKHTMRIETNIAVHPPGNFTGTAVLARVQRVAELPFEVLHPDIPSAGRVQVDAEWARQNVRLSVNGGRTAHMQEPYLQIGIYNAIGGFPDRASARHVAARVIVRAGDSVWQGDLLPAEHGSIWSTTVRLPGFKGDRVDVDLVPSYQAAVRSVKIDEFVGNVLRFRDARVPPDGVVGPSVEHRPEVMPWEP